MKQESKDEELIRDYLLGRLTEDKMRSVDERLITDKEFSELALAVESILVEDYIEDALDGEDRKGFESLFLATQQGRGAIRFTRELKEYALKSRERQSGFASSRWALAAAAILLIGLGIGLWRTSIVYSLFNMSEIDKGLAALKKAYREQPIDARITGLSYPPRRDFRAGAEERVDQVKIKQAETSLTQEARNNPNSESFYAVGRLFLIKRDFNQAIDYLSKALELDPANAQIHSDLGAAFLEKGKAVEQEDPDGAQEYYSSSLKYLSKALELQPNLLEAVFNRALLYQEMGRFTEAVNEWHDYLNKDPNPPWAGEARRKIDAINNQR